MSQYDFGTIDPFVVDGTTLAGMLNNWRDALYSLHRGATRPDYAVPGMLWISDVGGPTNWVVNVYLGPAVGDRPILQVNTTTGAIAQVADQLSAALISAQAAANPSLVLKATANATDLKTWRTLVDSAGLLQFQSLTDAGVVQNAIKFERNGTMHVVAPGAADNSDLVPTTAWVRANNAAAAVVLTHAFATVGVQIPVAYGLMPLQAPTVDRGGYLVGSRYTPPAGVYRVVQSAGVGNTGGNVNVVVSVRKNGAEVLTAYNQAISSSSSASAIVSGLVSMNGTDYLEPWWIASLAQVNTTNTSYFNAQKVA